MAKFLEYNIFTKKGEYFSLNDNYQNPKKIELINIDINMVTLKK
jgi:hypothetical protein